MKRYSGIVQENFLQKYPEFFQESDSFQTYVSNNVNLEGVLACAAMFAPEFLEWNGRVYLKDGVSFNSELIPEVSSIACLVGDNEIEIQKYINLFSFSDFFLLAQSEALNIDELLMSFAVTMKQFWQMRLNHIFKDREFKFIIDWDMYGEEGLCMTFYEAGR